MPDPQLTEGQQLTEKARGRGFSDDEISQWQGQLTQTMRQRGFSPQEVNDFWGQKDFNPKPLQEMAKKNIAAANAPSADGQKPKREPIDTSVKPVAAEDIKDAMAAAYGNSILQLFSKHEESPIEVPDNATWGQHLANTATGTLADSPVMFLGALGAGPVGAFGLPAGLRATFIDHIRNGEFTSPGDFAARATNIAWETAKGAATGYLTMATGENVQAINALAESPFVKAITGTAGRYAAELSAQTTVSSALEGRLPHARDFVNGAIMTAGLHAVGAAPDGSAYISRKFQNLWSNTGAHPQEVMEVANNDPHIRGQILSDNPNLPPEAAERKIDVPSQAEQEKLGLKPVDSEGKVAEQPIQEQKVKPGFELPEKERQEALSRIGQPEDDTKNFIEKVKAAKDAAINDTAGLYVHNVDWTSRIKNVLETIGKDPLDKDSSYVLMRLFAAHNDTIHSVLTDGTRDFNTDKVNGESLENIYNEYRNKTGDKSLNNLRAFMLADRGLELQRRGIAQPGDHESGAALVSAGEKAGYREFAKRVVDFQNRVNRYFGDSGFYTNEQMDRMEKEGQSYVPSHKIVESEPELGGKKGSRASFMKSIGDSDLKLVDPLESIRKDTETKIKMSLVNQAVNRFKEELSQAEKPDDWFRTSEDQGRKALFAKTKELQDAFDQQGIKANAKDYVVYRKNPGSLSEGQVGSWKDGKYEVVDMDPGVAEALKKMSGNYPALNVWLKVLRSSAYLLRFGVVENPLTGFPIGHILRNELTGPTLSKTGLAPADVIRYAPEYLKGVFGKGSEDFKNAVYNGAFVNARDKIPDGYYSDQIRNLDAEVPWIKKAWNTVDDNVLNFSRLLITHHDNALRFAELKKLKAAGASDQEAAFGARQVLPDVQKQGLMDSALKNVVAFLNIHAQGQARMGEALNEQAKEIGDIRSGEKNPSALAKGYLAKNLAYITTTSLLMAAANSGDSVIDDSPDHEKWNYWNFHIHDWRETPSLALAMSQKAAYPETVKEQDGKYFIDDGWRYKLQKPFTNGILFGSTPEALMESIKKDKPELFAHFLKTVATSTVQEPVPTGIAPLMDWYRNQNSYTGKPIARFSMENKLPEYDYDAYTSETAKRMAQLLSNKWVPKMGPDDAPINDPRVIEHLVRGYMGSTGQMLLNLSDSILAKAGITPEKTTMEKTIYESPFFRRFMARFPDSRPQSIDDFEQSFKLASEIQHTVQVLGREGKADQAAELQQKYIANEAKLTGIENMIKNHRHAQMAIVSDPKMSQDDKGQLFDIMTFEMIAGAKEGNRVMNELSKLQKGQ